MSVRKSAYQTSRPGKRPRFAVFDTETDGLGGPVVAATWRREGDDASTYIAGGDVLQKLFLVMCENHDYTWFAHNAQYDLRGFTSRLIERKNDLQIYLKTDSDAFMVTLELPEYGDRARLCIRDSMALFPASLAKFADVMCPEFPKFKLDFDKVQFDPINREHIEYALRDTDALLFAITRFADLIFDTFGIHIRTTTASTALAAWERTLEKDEYYRNPNSAENFVRSGYYGGLVFLTDTRHYSGPKTYDINSSYPYQMLTYDVPIGNPTRTKFIKSGYLGIYRVTIKSPDDLVVPIIPVRDHIGVVWPTGIFETTLTSIELNFALEHGYRILQVHEGMFWEKSGRPFERFISKCRKLRIEHKGTALETVAKLMQNSLYGKFATKRKRRKIYSYSPDDAVFGCDMWGEFYIRDEIDDEMMCLPQWSVFITAYARRHLLEAVYAIGPENVLYGDTDSITLKPGYELPDNMVGKEYGKFKLEKEWQSFRARSPKVYAGLLPTGNVVELKGAIKGVPRSKWKSSGALQAVYDGSNETVKYETLNSFLRVLRGDKAESYEAKRSISDLERSRNWKPQCDGTVRPRSFEEIQNRSKRLRAPADFGFAPFTDQAVSN